MKTAQGHFPFLVTPKLQLSLVMEPVVLLLVLQQDKSQTLDLLPLKVKQPVRHSFPSQKLSPMKFYSLNQSLLKPNRFFLNQL